MGILKRKSKVPDQRPKNPRIERMPDEMLYTHAENQLMDAGYRLSRWRETEDVVELDQAQIAARWAAEALAELFARS